MAQAAGHLVAGSSFPCSFEFYLPYDGLLIQQFSPSVNAYLSESMRQEGLQLISGVSSQFMNSLKPVISILKHIRRGVSDYMFSETFTY